MRRRHEQIEVRLGRIGEGVAGLEPVEGGIEEGPSQFLWRDRLWRVLHVQAHWVESGPWWESAGARAARGDWQEADGGFDAFLPAPGRPEEAAGGEGSPLLEYALWRVEAASGQAFSRGVYELAQDVQAGSWELRAVLD